jgi:hypothetical protein
MRLLLQAEKPHLEYSAKLMREAAAEITRLRSASNVVDLKSSGHVNLSPPSAGFGIKSG